MRVVKQKTASSGLLRAFASGSTVIDLMPPQHSTIPICGFLKHERDELDFSVEQTETRHNETVLLRDGLQFCIPCAPPTLDFGFFSFRRLIAPCRLVLFVEFLGYFTTFVSLITSGYHTSE